MDAYHKGLTGKGAAWACKKYRGHRCVPESILAEFNDSFPDVSDSVNNTIPQPLILISAPQSGVGWTG